MKVKKCSVYLVGIISLFSFLLFFSSEVCAQDNLDMDKKSITFTVIDSSKTFIDDKKENALFNQLKKYPNTGEHQNTIVLALGILILGIGLKLWIRKTLNGKCKRDD